MAAGPARPARVVRAALSSLGLLVVFGVGSSAAHGPTVEIGPEGLRPPLLNLYAGTTVHFANRVATPSGVVVLVDEAGDVRSPVLKAPGDGWHHTFEGLGRHVIRLAERPDATMTIMIVPRRTP